MSELSESSAKSFDSSIDLNSIAGTESTASLPEI